MEKIKIKRIYESASREDGTRILVDRLWPRGLSKENAKVDVWLPEVAPSHALRKWFSHDPEKWEHFKKKYFEELLSEKESILKIRQYVKKGTLTLLYGAKDTIFNNAVVLREYLKEKKGES